MKETGDSEEFFQHSKLGLGRTFGYHKAFLN